METGGGTSGASSLENVMQRLQSLELRVAGMEKMLAPGAGVPHETIAHLTGTAAANEDDGLIVVDEGALESRIGEYGLAWLGSLVLLFGIAFLMTYILGKGYTIMPTVLGYTSVLGIFIASHYLRNTFPHIVFMFNIAGHLLAWYTTLRIFYFTPHPLIPSQDIVTVMLLVAVTVQCILAVRKKSEVLAGIALVMALATALIADSEHVTLSVVLMTAGAALFFYIRYGWWRLLAVSMALVYLVHILWLLNNPFLGHDLGFFPGRSYSVLYLFGTGIIYAMMSRFPRTAKAPEISVNTISMLNGIAFSMVIFIVTAMFFRDHYVLLFGVITAFCLAWSVFLELSTQSRFTPSLFACFGFMALSVMVYGMTKLPDSFFFLALQSFLVVVIALWYRSRIIVVVNTVLFMGILLAYLLGSAPVSRISFCFAIVAFLTARILNWKKERLTLKTDLMRNLYLFALFFTMLYAMYHAVPARYITLSWTAVAAGYFILSMILRNIKYRWLAIATLLATVVYLFAVDLAHLEVGYRVIAFLFLAAISISASLYYTKRIRKKREQAAGVEKEA